MLCHSMIICVIVDTNLSCMISDQVEALNREDNSSGRNPQHFDNRTSKVAASLHTHYDLTVQAMLE